MGAYVSRRVLFMIPILFGISLVAFGIVRLAPGDPAALVSDPLSASPQQIAAARHQLGLDQPVPVQYVKTMGALVSGQLHSFRTGQPVFQMLGERLPTTLTLAVLTIVFGTLVGIGLGMAQALRPYSKLDDLGAGLSLFGFSIPQFWLALMLALLFSVKLRWLPSVGIQPPGSTGFSFIRALPYVVMPVLVLSVGFVTGSARYVRSSMIGVLKDDYIRTAHAKGLMRRQVIVRHALRNSLLPLVTFVALFIPILLGATAVVEEIFSLPGLGSLVLDSIFARDYPVVI
ncbi:MAG: ABC transporter permease, partial [Chloroflexi bacterium]|nr:ABC transporter permease [Chloroflexota bacterium]